MPCGIYSCATCHNLKPALTIKMDDVDQYFTKKIMSNFYHNTTCYILIDGWQLMTSTWYRGCNYNGVG
jgi:hypothetical protein